ncbi:complement C1q tumor necrosis factor-related protein 3 isoform X2 [Ovis canadensis]|uniref:complement C1q tumor necrosis factor-related protein 3 isoform X2 n=1 Tax=Ovis canadensis TaxID=37174 RepID=UPI00375234F5
MLGRQLVYWHLLALLFLPFCLCQDEYMEVSGRANKVVARIVQSHQQTGRSGSRREKVRERSHPRAGTVDNNTSTDLKSLRPDELPPPEVDDLAQTIPFWGQSPQTGGLPPDCSKCCHGDYSFRGYQGPPGPPGPPGIPGNHGNNGNNGATGHEGAKGEKGDKGDLGPRGERGQHGPKGEKGYPGIPPELQIAFMASLATHFTNQNSGIIFSSVETNIGNFFDVMTGRFGAPVSALKNPPANACQAGDIGLIPGSGRFLEEGDSYPVFLPGKFHRRAWQATLHEVSKELDTTLGLKNKNYFV